MTKAWPEMPEWNAPADNVTTTTSSLAFFTSGVQAITPQGVNMVFSLPLKHWKEGREPTASIGAKKTTSKTTTSKTTNKGLKGGKRVADDDGQQGTGEANTNTHAKPKTTWSKRSHTRKPTGKDDNRPTNIRLNREQGRDPNVQETP